MLSSISYSALGLSLIAGALTTLSPCVFPILPLVVGSTVQANRLAPVAMGVGMAGSFALIGLILGALGPTLGIDGDSVRTAGGALLIAFAVVMLVPWLSERFAALVTPLASSANAASSKLDSGSLWGALLLGGVLGLVWSPCSGPLLASALALVASEGGALRGTIILGLFGVGAAIPLVTVAYASRAGFSKVRGIVLGKIDRIKKVFGIIIGITGIAILTGADKWLEAKILDLLPQGWQQITVLF